MKNSIFNLITAPWKISVTFTAIRLNLFTFLANNEMTVEEIALKCHSIPHLLKPLLDACESIGFLMLENDKYRNSHFSRVHLVEGEPLYVGDLVKLQYNESKQWDKLYDIILGIEEKNVDRRVEEDKHRTFIKAMNNLGMLGEAEALKNSIDLSECKKLVDAGGGSGLYSLVLCQKYPDLRSTILDKSETLAVTKEMIKGRREKEQITLREADITNESFGKNTDVVLLSDVVYDEAAAKPILRNAWNCLFKNGLLVIRGYYSDPEGSKPLFGALFVHNLLVFDPFRTVMSISALRKNVIDTGFTVIKLSPLTELSFVLIARK
jgi:hypothetical protein